MYPASFPRRTNTLATSLRRREWGDTYECCVVGVGTCNVYMTPAQLLANNVFTRPASWDRTDLHASGPRDCSFKTISSSLAFPLAVLGIYLRIYHVSDL